MGSNSQDDREQEWSCCNDEQSLFLFLYMAFAILAVVFSYSMIARPVRMIATFIHEMGHACACWLTGGYVRAIKVFENEGGVTEYAGGCRCLIIPAGYVGTSFFAMIFVALSGGRRTATAVAVIFTVALLVSLCYSPNQTTVYLNLGYAVLMTAFIFIEWFWITPILQYVILFFGVSIGIIAIQSIHSDTILRALKGSDSYACSEEVWTGCNPKCIGLQWAVLAIFFQLLGMWLALVEMSNECEDLGWFECLHLSVDFDFELGDNFDFDGFWHNGP